MTVPCASRYSWKAERCIAFRAAATRSPPTTPHGFKDAVSDAAAIARLWSHYPGQLVGVPTGVISGIDVIDIDPRHGGDQWFFENRDRLPKTRTHETKRFGQHLVYRHMSGVRCSTNKIAPGVDLRVTAGS
jgi:hypothetical protein